ncbi:MAG TPA: sulfatase-like hydrolase/transferase [Kofleriaceae bacterium]|nr:sulfatase-like hydrolase/transferase [Kofleriaceae bacterium]
MSEGAPPPPYRSGLATGAGVVLVAGLVLAIADVVHTGAAPLQVLGLWSLLTLPVAIGAGLVIAAGNATWGSGWVRRLFRRLSEDDELDRTVSAILIAAVVVAGVLILGVAKLSVGLVGDVQRKSVGGLLLGVIVVALVPVLALAVLPLFRVTRKITGVVPSIGPLSRVLLLTFLGAVLVACAGLFVIFKKLDYQALNLGSLFVPAMMPILAIVIAIVFYGPLSGVRERIPSRVILVSVGLMFAILIAVFGLRGEPSQKNQVAVLDRSYVGPRLIPVLRKLSDHDHDGYSAFFGGPDCNDRDKAIHPNVIDVPDNTIDENCDGFDNQKAPTLPDLPTGKNAPAPTLKGGDNVLVIFVDTLRYDRLGFTGYQRDGKSLTPRIDAFAKQSVVFKNAYSQASNTPRSVPSFLASQYPTKLKVDAMEKNYPLVLDDNELLFEVLKPAGFTTIGESSHFYFCDRQKYAETCSNVKNTDGNPMRTNAIQGADLWDNTGALPISGSNHDIAGPRVVEKTKKKLAELAAGKQKFAMIVHLFEPHSTYMEHDGMAITERGTASLMQKYDYEIAFEDKLIGELLDELDTLKLAGSTTVVLMSDHGEAFGIHTFAGEKQFFHGMTLYNEVLHVPLMFRVPNNKPREVSDVVELIDLSPTIASLFGVTPPKSWVGRSLVGALEGAPLPAKPAFSEMPPSKSWPHDARSMISADGKHHVFHRISDSRWEVYDLAADPEERKNVVDSDTQAKQLQQQLASWEQSLLSGANQ